MFNDISIIIPYKETAPDRARIHEFVLRRYYEVLPGAEICVGTNEGEFNHAKSFNDALRKATRRYVVLMDGDALINPDSILRSIDLLSSHSVVITHDVYMKLSFESSAYVMNNNIMIINSATPNINGISYSYPMDCMIIMERDMLNKTGCFDERFKGWGYTDEAFRRVLSHVAPSMIHLQNSTIYHLAHEYIPSFKDDNLLSQNLQVLNTYYNPSTIQDTINSLINQYHSL